MKIEIKNVKDCKRVLEVSLPPDKVKNKINTLYQNYQKTLNIKGFRKGKIPMSIIKGRFGDAVRKESVDSIIKEVYKETIKKENLSPITQGIIENVKFDDNEGLSFKATFEVLPDIKPQNYKGIKVEKLSTQVTEKDIKDMLLKLQDSKATYVPLLTRSALPGDMLLVDYEVLVEEKGVIRKNKVSNYTIVLDAPGTPKEFTQGLTNSMPGDRRKVSLRYPLDFKDENLRGKWVEYEFLIHEVKEKKLPNLDNEFAKDLNFASLKELKQQIKKELKKGKEQNSIAKIKTQIINQLIDENPFEAPTSIVNAYLTPMLEKVGDKIDEKLKKNLAEIAIWRAKREILLTKIAELENIKLTDKELKSKLLETKEGQKMGYEQTVKTLKDRGIFAPLVEEFRIEKVLDFLVKESK